MLALDFASSEAGLSRLGLPVTLAPPIHRRAGPACSSYGPLAGTARRGTVPSNQGEDPRG
jgi:hypothetical protein